MAYYKTCPECGAALDPGEICDCREMQKNAEHKKTAPEAADNRSGKTEKASYQLNHSRLIIQIPVGACQY